MKRSKRRLRNRRHHAITEHIWRALRASMVLIGMLIWLAQDGFKGSDYIILLFGLLAGVLDQLHGYICCLIERVFGWKEDFDKWG